MITEIEVEELEKTEEIIKDIKKEETNKQQIELVLIDGVAGSGKSRIARYLAQSLKSCYFDAGKVVRLISAYLLYKGLKKGKKDMKYEIIDMIKMMPDIKIVKIGDVCFVDCEVHCYIILEDEQITTHKKTLNSEYGNLELKEITELSSIIATYSCVKDRILRAQNDVINNVIAFNSIPDSQKHDKYPEKYIIFVASNLVQYSSLKMHNIFLTAHINKRAIRRFVDILNWEQRCISPSLQLGYNSRDISNFKELKAFYKSVRSSLRYTDLRARAIEDINDKIISTKAFIIDTTNKTIKECYDLCVEYINRNTGKEAEETNISLEKAISNLFKKSKQQRQYIKRKCAKVNKTCNLYTEYAECESCG